MKPRLPLTRLAVLHNSQEAFLGYRYHAAEKRKNEVQNYCTAIWIWVTWCRSIKVLPWKVELYSAEPPARIIRACDSPDHHPPSAPCGVPFPPRPRSARTDNAPAQHGCHLGYYFCTTPALSLLTSVPLTKQYYKSFCEYLCLPWATIMASLQ